MIPANELGSSVAKSDGVRKDRKEYTTKTEDWQYKRQEESKEEQIYEENGSIGVGDCDDGELSECGKCAEAVVSYVCFLHRYN